MVVGQRLRITTQHAVATQRSAGATVARAALGQQAHQLCRLPRRSGTGSRGHGARAPGAARATLQQEKQELAVPQAVSTEKASVAPVSPSSTIIAQVQKELKWDRDEYKEQARREMRTVFDFPQWANHRSTKRYARHIRYLTDSRIAKGLVTPLLYEAGLASLVCAYHTAVQAGFLPALEPTFDLHSPLPVNLTAFALSLLLVFRTTNSYNRFDEARKLWGSQVNRSRDLTRLGLTWFPEDRPEMLAMLRRWTKAFNVSLMCHLRDTDDPKVELGAVLTERELAAVLAATHRPNYCLQVLSNTLKNANVTNPAALLRMDQNIAVFEDAAGACERIFRTPIPLSYTRHTSRFMMIWLSLLPFALWDACHWMTIPVAVMIAFLLLSIEEIGVSIEEPFSILPLEAICATINKNVDELHSMHAGRSKPQNGSLPPAPSAGELVATAELN